MLEARLPGVRFETRLQPVEEALPRMDIAAFVGFAAAGPLHLPVAVEDPGRFREIFGPDPELAWDAVQGSVRYGALGPTIESFFANGGRRCWIVRVADRETAVRHRFLLPGVEVAGAPSGAEPVAARARAAGSWCEDLAAGTTLRREVVPLRRFTLEAEEDEEPPFALAAAGYRLDLVATASEIEVGELLELFFDPELPRLWLFVDAVEEQRGFLRLRGADRLVDGETDGAFWVAPAATSPVEEASRLVRLEEAMALVELDAAGVLDTLASWPDPSALDGVSVRRLRLELNLWRGAGLVARLGGLAFARRHPRCWGRLATDELLFGSPSGARRAREPESLDAEIASPRFPLAGPVDDLDRLPRFYLPLAVDDRRDPAAAAGPAKLTGTALERDGLASFSEALFVDPALAPVRHAVLAEAEHRYYVREVELDGMHSLLPVLEASMVAVPDAHHSGWTRRLTCDFDLLPAPELDPIPEPDALSRYAIAWSEVAGATGYRLERDQDPDFPAPVMVYEGERGETAMYLAPACPRRIYLRVRALRSGEVSPWSNTRQAVLPAPEFTPCEGRPPAELLLLEEAASSPPDHGLVWQPLAGDRLDAAKFEVQEAVNADFVGAESATTEDLRWRVVEPSDAPAFYRVRGRSGELRGPWSNTVVIEPLERVNWTLVPEADYNDGVLLATHRAQLRFAAARGDAIALLSLPRHYRVSEAALHVGRLNPGGEEQLAATASRGTVPPLSFGEERVLSYGALFHPWLTVRVPDRGAGREEVTRHLPPDGAVAGSMARLTLERGAWLAAANRPLARVLATMPPVDLEAWRRLVPLRVNLAVRAPQGFLLMSEDTLSREPSLVPIHVRRLLILVALLAKREGDRFVFEPHGSELRHRVRHRFESVLADLYTRGAFAGANPAGAFRVITGESVNPPASVERGRFIVELQIAPAQALAFITVRLVADERGRLTVEEA